MSATFTPPSKMTEAEIAAAFAETERLAELRAEWDRGILPFKVRSTREVCGFCEGEHQLHIETPMLRSDITNAVVRAELPIDSEICEACADRIAESIGEDWREDKEFRTYIDVCGWRHYTDGEVVQVDG